jgi:hypothetical protein
MFAFAIDVRRFARSFASHATKKFLTALYLALTGWMGTFLGFCGVVTLSVKSHRPHKPMLKIIVES